MSKMFNGVKGVVARQAQGVSAPRWGIVESFDPDTYTVTVRVMPEDKLTGWLPIKTAHVGSNVGMFVGPTPGQQAFLVPDSADNGSYVVTGFAYSDQNRVPAAADKIRGDDVKVKPGEVVFVGPHGSVVRIASDGTIFMKAKTVNIEGDLEVSGDIHTEKNVFADENVEAKKNVEADVDVKAGGQVEDFHNTLDALRQDYNAHQHPAGFGGLTGPTTKPD